MVVQVEELLVVVLVLSVVEEAEEVLVVVLESVEELLAVVALELALVWGLVLVAVAVVAVPALAKDVVLLRNSMVAPMVWAHCKWNRRHQAQLGISTEQSCR